ncbi:hypothetical protein [Actinomycetospora flava]|uniref:Uncharacterized protein n=1 Tax=Actinomycetospora flava TaxID=3129232 RepID=A0ABU8LZ49_9PSEU
MTTALPDASTPTDPAEIVVAVPDDAATLSCRLHGVIAGAGEGAVLTIVVEAGDRAADPDLARVLSCARDAATGRGLGFVIR